MPSRQSRTPTLDSLHAMMRDPRYWNANNPEHESWVARVASGFGTLYPDGVGHDATGRQSDHTGHGGTVHVNDYVRTVNGEDVHVSDYDRAWPSGSGNARSMEHVAANAMPKAPPGVDIDRNIKEAEEHWARTVIGDLWFYDQVKSYGPWDYKRISKEYEPFGNFHYGAVGAAMGYSLDTLQRMAGWYQVTHGKSDPSWGVRPVYLRHTLGLEE